ncbi:MAG: prephenate dehydratase domain-containing protein, partial [Candidatus Dormibacteria bacterium]
MGTRYAYLGPQGTFAETAVRSLPESGEAELIPVETVADAFAAVRDGS